ncbi:hypothetical protein J6590_053171 [Homalodisca vitripennis]|nr:hypothetical protein J6590_053171 [Homalodisca vitripennis]
MPASGALSYERRIIELRHGKPVSRRDPFYYDFYYKYTNTRATRWTGFATRRPENIRHRTECALSCSEANQLNICESYVTETDRRGFVRVTFDTTSGQHQTSLHH